MRKICQVTNDLHFRMPGNGEVVVHNRLGQHGQPVRIECFPDERRNIAGRPNFHTARNEFAVQLHAFLGNVRCACVRAHFYAKLELIVFARSRTSPAG